MCVLCMMSPGLNPLTLAVDGPSRAIILELGDALEGIETQYRISVGDTFQGEISSSTDEDWVAIDLVAGTTYSIGLIGDTLEDPYLTLFDNNGFFLTANDDGFSFPIRDSLITFTADYTGTHYIEADDFDTETGQTGTYELSVFETTPPPPVVLTEGTFDELADYLMDGGSGETYFFDTSQSNVITVDITGLTIDGQQLAIWAMDAWEMVADVEFAVRGGGLNEFAGEEMITADDEDEGAFAYFPNAGSTDMFEGDSTTGVELNVSRGWLFDYGTTIDSFSFQTYVHEFGHALGLHHLGPYNGFGDYPFDAVFSNDSWQVSVMSYFSQSDNTSVDAIYAGLLGPMMADIIAIQDFYGAPGANGVTAGDTTYGLNSNLGNYLDEVFTVIVTGESSANFLDENVMAITIYDQDGTDTIDFSFFEEGTDTRFNLASGTFSDVGQATGVIGIAVGTEIENLYTGAGNDLLSGNGASNYLRAGAGNDTAYGGGGNDTIEGEDGDDAIFGGALNDDLFGGNGNDLIGGGSGNDQINGGLGNDTIWGSGGDDFIFGNEDDDLIGAGTGKDVVYGDAGNDVVYGGGSRDDVFGGEGNDLVGGGFGRDSLYGNDGDDTLWGQVGDDVMYGGAGNDIMAGGSGGDVMYGGDNNDDMSGAFGSDTLYGQSGNDILNGNFGNDVLTGGSGRDTFVFDAGGNKTVTDLTLSHNDALMFDLESLGVTGGLTGKQIVDTYADDSSGTVVFTINGLSVTLQGWSSTANLEFAFLDDSLVSF